MFVISSHALAREVLRDPNPGLCISMLRVAVSAYRVRPAGTRFDCAMLVRSLLQEADAPFIVRGAPGCGEAVCEVPERFPLALGDGGWYREDKEDLRVRLANRLLAAPERRLVLPVGGCGVSAHYFRPSYIETR